MVTSTSFQIQADGTVVKQETLTYKLVWQSSVVMNWEGIEFFYQVIKLGRRFHVVECHVNSYSTVRHVQPEPRTRKEAQEICEALLECTRNVCNSENKNREFVMSYMHWDGENHYRLTTDEWQRVYLLGSGFGEISYAKANTELDWDWSHVRDSHAYAFNRMRSEIERIVATKEVTA